MPSKSRARRDLDDLRRNIVAVHDGNPLRQYANRLLTLIDYSAHSVDVGAADPSQLLDVNRIVRAALECLPDTFGERFLVDSAMLMGVSEEWAKCNPQLEFTAAPKYQADWGHATVPIFGVDGKAVSLDVVMFPGSDSTSSLFLPEYAWLMHELGHNVHFRFQHFQSSFDHEVQSTLRQMQRRSIADRGIALDRSRRKQRRFESVWAPAADHRCWSCEIAVDLVALWTCGPAFLDAYASAVREKCVEPDVLTSEHPPYRLRTIALHDAACRLGWHDDVDKIGELLSNWSGDKLDRYDYASLPYEDEGLTSKCVTKSLQFCETVRLPRLTKKVLDGFRCLVDTPADCDFGTSVLLGTHLAQKHLDEEQFGTWHDAVVEELASSVTQ